MSTWKELCRLRHAFIGPGALAIDIEEFDKIRAVVEAAQSIIKYEVYDKRQEAFRDLEKALGAIDEV